MEIRAMRQSGRDDATNKGGSDLFTVKTSKFCDVLMSSLFIWLKMTTMKIG